MLFTTLSALVVLVLIAGLFGAAGARLRRAFGTRAVLALWIGVPAAMSAIGIGRAIGWERNSQYQPVQEHPLWMFALFTAVLLVALAPAAMDVARRVERSAGTSALRAALLLLPGLLLAILLLVGLELGGVDFLPPT